MALVPTSHCRPAFPRLILQELSEAVLTQLPWKQQGHLPFCCPDTFLSTFISLHCVPALDRRRPTDTRNAFDSDVVYDDLED